MDSTSVPLEEAFAGHLESIFRYCHRMTGSQEEAEDLAQETLLSALKQTESFRGEADLRSWLFGIAHHKVSHHLRRRAIERLFVPVARQEPEFSGEMAVQELIDSLPPRQREAFLLVKVEGFTSLEAAEILGIPNGTVKHRVYVAVRRLQESLLASGTLPKEAPHVP